MSRAPGRGFGRRTVLQLDDKPKNNSGFGLSGLIASYGESDEEEETKVMQQNYDLSAESSRSGTPTPAPTDSKSQTPKENGNKPEIDNKLADFLAEINAMDTGEDSNGIDGAPINSDKENAAENGKSPENDENKSDSSDEEPEIEELKTRAPQTPTTVWQHCLDDGTQCYYYWNISTNEVTWEIPPEYSQFLLQQKEYEEQLVYYQKQMAEFENEKKLREQRILEKKAQREKEKEESSNSSSSGVIGPELPPHLTSVSNPSSPRPFSQYEDSKDAQDRVSKIYKEESGIIKSHSEPELATRFEDMASSQPTNTLKKGYINFVAAKEPLVPKEPATETKKVESSISKFKKDNKNVKDFNIGDSVSNVMIGPSLPPEGLPVSQESELTNQLLGSVSHDNGISQSKAKEPNQPITAEKRNEADGDDSDFDMDDIDRQLELAFERKESEEERGQKRKSCDPDSPLLKRPKSDPCSDAYIREPIVNPPSHTPPSKKLDRTSVKFKAELAGVSSVIMDKLEFLEISRKGLSKLQILFIELETRLQDWRDGALDSEYLLIKLQEADSQLRHYEISAAPPGWSCHWDRAYRRYFYSSVATGETQWDFPEDVVEAQREPAPPSYPPQGNVRKPPSVLPPNHQRFKDNGEDNDMENLVSSSVGEYRCPVSSKNLDPGSSVNTTAFSHELPDAISLAKQPPPPPPPPVMFPNGIDPNPPPPPPPPEMGCPGLLPPPPPPPENPAPSSTDPQTEPQNDVTESKPENEGYDLSYNATFVQDSVISAAPTVATSASSASQDNQTLASVPLGAVANAPGSESSTPNASPSRPSSSLDAPASTSPVPMVVHGKDKKKKKEKKQITGNLALKKKDFPSLVQKWRQIQDEVGREKGVPPNASDS